VSVDSIYVHKMWNDHELAKMVEGGIPFHMAADAAGNVGKVYGVYNEDSGVEFRGRFIIDPDGVIQAMEVLTPPVGRKLAESIRQVQAFQVVRASKGAEATPAGWEPGKLTLKPGAGAWNGGGRYRRTIYDPGWQRLLGRMMNVFGKAIDGKDTGRRRRMAFNPSVPVHLTEQATRQKYLKPGSRPSMFSPRWNAAAEPVYLAVLASEKPF
jgi:hypothetical protein